MSRLPQILVVGGNGFLGSAICKEALSRGWKVVSISQSGKAFVSPAGHQPAWSSSSSISWKSANANNPSTYSHLLDSSDAVVHTLGILLEGDYKGKGKDSAGPLSGVKALVEGWRKEAGWEDTGNPLEQRETRRHGKYEAINRDSALTVARAFMTSRPGFSSKDTLGPSPFIYISAEDIFRPIIPSRYIETKREAEVGILRLAAQTETDADFASKSSRRQDKVSNERTVLADDDGAGLGTELEQEIGKRGPNTNTTSERSLRQIRPVFIRPGLMYHPHTRPLSTLPAAFFDLTSTLHSKHLRSNLLSSLPTPSSILSKISSRLDPISKLISLSPLHVDTVAKAVCESIIRDNVRGEIETEDIKRLSGWKEYRKQQAKQETEEKVHNF